MRLELPNPVEAIKFELDQRGLTLFDLEDVIGRYEAVRTSRLSSATRMVRLSIKRVGSVCLARKGESAIPVARAMRNLKQYVFTRPISTIGLTTSS